MTLGIDIETYSSVSLKQSGVYKYASAPDFTILLLSYCLSNGPVVCVDLASGESLPKEFLNAYINPDVKKTAYNAQFERVCLNEYFLCESSIDEWECTMVRAGMVGLPMNLEMCGKVLHTNAEKDLNGKKLLRYFTIPCKPTKANGGRLRNLPEHDPQAWEEFKHYNIRDVEVEQEIRDKINPYPISFTEAAFWQMDQAINDYGIAIDPLFVKTAIKFEKIAREKLLKKAVLLTGLDNPNSAAQIKDWLECEIGSVDNLQKKNIPVLIDQAFGNGVATEVLKIRQDLSKTSVKKYIRMIDCMTADRRVRGLVQFYGANRTGRFAGRLIQVQNLPRHSLKDLDLARELVLADDYEMFEMLFSPVTDTLSQLIRTSFIPSHGNKFIISDFSAIEARVIAWLAGERWRLDVFSTHGMIYEASGAAMFHIPIENVIGEVRYKSKIAELALGFGGSVGAMIRMGALDQGLKEDELLPIVRAWRAANKNIVRLWYNLEEAALTCLQEGVVTKVGPLKFFYKNKILFLQLPSGRKLSYINPVIKEGTIYYEGVDQTSKKWRRLDVYGGKFAENATQGIARDLLCEKMYMLHQGGYRIAMHVHDEIVIDAYDDDDANEVHKIMIKPVFWAKGLPLGAKTFESNYYKKD